MSLESPLPRSACEAHRDEVHRREARLAAQLNADVEYGTELAGSRPAAFSLVSDAQRATRDRFAQEERLDRLCERLSRLEAIHVTPLTDHEWVDMLNPEGDLLPRCCGAVSAFRDALPALLRTPELALLRTSRETISSLGLNLWNTHGELLTPRVIDVLAHFGSQPREYWKERARRYQEDTSTIMS